ncbi:MAG TPA: FAD-binding and (Fe-S)-binding domain-containing protein [Pseudonocardiaceae bacterium]|nr:FAD-binding and (Fe-S)-binding domain-containing protein [Pseudonocardiaceae bacterium]
MEDEALGAALRAAVQGEVSTDAGTRALYATDASNYRVPPRAVVLPRGIDDVAAVIEICRERGVPLTPRGAGTSVAGNAIGPGVVLDFSRHLDAVLDLDPATKLARVQPGVVLDTLQAAAARHGLRFGPDPSTHGRATLGGMIGNNACGTHSVAWGTTAQSVEELVVLQPDGTQLAAASGSLPPQVAALERAHRGLLRTALPAWARRGSGYRLEHLLPEHGAHLARALVGTEGTCVVLLEATVRLVAPPPSVALLVLGFPDVCAAADVAPGLLAHHPLTVEGMDATLIAALRARGRPVAELPAGGAWLLVEFGADTVGAAVAAAQAAATAVQRPQLVVTDPAHRAALWRIREAGAGLVTRLADGTQTWPGWEDAAVPPARLGAYLGEFTGLLTEHGRQGSVYGHFGEGCVHVRTDADLLTPAGRRDFRRFLEQAADLVVAHGGSLSGEHGDGRARSELLDRMYPPEVRAVFAAFKGIFDPEGVLNPGVLVDPRPLDADLRPGREQDVPVRLAFAGDRGSLATATRRCVGVGACRELAGPAVMCPSFQVTRDEQHSTRGRAHLLAEMLAGDLVTGGWRAPELREALDLCLACKACATDCPVGVDMASYKAEFLYQHYRRKLRPRWQYALGALPLAARLGGLAPGLANRLAPLLARLAGLSPARPLPRFVRYRPPVLPAGPAPRGTVLLWPDCFTRSFDPQVVHAAARVLRSAGFAVRLPRRTLCCGLTWIATGQLDVARLVLRRTLRLLRAELAAGVPVVGLEPSCLATLRSDLAELLPDHPDGAALARGAHTLAEVLRGRAPDWQPPRRAQPAVQQVHCHQHAVLGHAPDDELLTVAGVRVQRAAGCCGLAGSFGYQRGHEAVSAALVERSLAPAVRAAPDALVLADGFSCRLQIAQTTGRRGLHLAELLVDLLGEGRVSSGKRSAGGPSDPG